MMLNQDKFSTPHIDIFSPSLALYAAHQNRMDVMVSDSRLIGQEFALIKLCLGIVISWRNDVQSTAPATSFTQNQQRERAQ